MRSRHLDDLDLLALASSAAPERPPWVRHVETCAHCRRQQERLVAVAAPGWSRVKPPEKGLAPHSRWRFHGGRLPRMALRAMAESAKRPCRAPDAWRPCKRAWGRAAQP